MIGLPLSSYKAFLITRLFDSSPKKPFVVDNDLPKNELLPSQLTATSPPCLLSSEIFLKPSYLQSFGSGRTKSG